MCDKCLVDAARRTDQRRMSGKPVSNQDQAGEQTERELRREVERLQAQAQRSWDERNTFMQERDVLKIQYDAAVEEACLANGARAIAETALNALKSQRDDALRERDELREKLKRNWAEVISKVKDEVDERGIITGSVLANFVRDLEHQRDDALRALTDLLTWVGGHRPDCAYMDAANEAGACHCSTEEYRALLSQQKAEG